MCEKLAERDGEGLDSGRDETLYPQDLISPSSPFPPSATFPSSQCGSEPLVTEKRFA